MPFFTLVCKLLKVKGTLKLIHTNVMQVSQLLGQYLALYNSACACGHFRVYFILMFCGNKGGSIT